MRVLGMRARVLDRAEYQIKIIYILFGGIRQIFIMPAKFSGYTVFTRVDIVP